MKVTKTEKIWLIVVTALYALYNFPGLPAYDQAEPMLWHAALTVIPKLPALGSRHMTQTATRAPP